MRISVLCMLCVQINDLCREAPCHPSRFRARETLGWISEGYRDQKIEMSNLKKMLVLAADAMQIQRDTTPALRMETKISPKCMIQTRCISKESLVFWLEESGLSASTFWSNVRYTVLSLKKGFFNLIMVHCICVVNQEPLVSDLDTEHTSVPCMNGTASS